MTDLYVVKGGQQLRCGYTTGSCAAGAAKAAALMWHTGQPIETVELDTPAGVRLTLPVSNPVISHDRASCSIVKDAGDDPDVTNGLEIVAEVWPRSDGQVIIEGGAGIGRITRPGFWGDVGAAAINPVPRRMIREAVQSVAEHGWNVLISAPHGAEIARKTYNAALGIAGGISILGTTGLVDPMSDEAFQKTIYLTIEALHQQGHRAIVLVLGNYGERMAAQIGLTAPVVKVSNFIGEALLDCQHFGFQRVTLLGQIGKLAKLAIGGFNTHSRVCDGRMEAFVYYLALAGAPLALLQEVNACTDAEAALRIVQRENYHQIIEAMRQGCIERIKRYVKNEQFGIDVVLYSLESGMLT